MTALNSNFTAAGACYLPADAAGLSSWGLRLWMAQRGWISETRFQERMSNRGQPLPVTSTFQTWFSRHDWHGRRISRVVFHTGADLDPSDPATAIPTALDVLRKTAGMALEAWDRMPEAVPCLALNDLIAVHTRETEDVFVKRRSREETPTEALPPDLTPLLDGAALGLGDDPVLSAMLRFPASRMDYEDDVTWSGRVVGDWHFERMWGYDGRAVPTHWNGEPVPPRPYGFSIDGIRQWFGALAESVVTLSIESQHDAMLRLQRVYRPGAPCGARPPGMRSWAEIYAEDEWKRRTESASVLAGHLAHGTWREDHAERVLENWSTEYAKRSWLHGVVPKPCMEDVRALAERLATEEQAENRIENEEGTPQP